MTTKFEEAKARALARLDEINSAKNHTCPLCSSPVDGKTRFTIPDTFTVFGMNIHQIRKMMNFADEHGYKYTKDGAE